MTSIGCAGRRICPSPRRHPARAPGIILPPAGVLPGKPSRERPMPDPANPADANRQPPYPSDYDNVKPGAPPRPKNEPSGSEDSTQTHKTLTDPATGAPTAGKPDTAL